MENSPEQMLKTLLKKWKTLGFTVFRRLYSVLWKKLFTKIIQKVYTEYQHEKIPINFFLLEIRCYFLEVKNHIARSMESLEFPQSASAPALR